MTNILILGSGPDVVQARDWDRTQFDLLLVINNAWQVRPDWDVLIHPEDFPADRQPPGTHGKQVVTATEYVPAQNSQGGFVYAGGTMAFTAGYWALHAYRPRLVAFMGCDMTYDAHAPTHFYGTGAPDPLRDDITLQSLEAKSTRLLTYATAQGCSMVNLSTGASRLTFPRATPDAPLQPLPDLNTQAITAARAMETALGYMAPDGRYWTQPDRFDPAKLRALDALWLRVWTPPALE